MRLILISFIIGLLGTAGCGTLIPKRVEFFQDKVHTYPEPKAREKEVQREAASRAAKVSLETLVSATAENASTNVTAPAAEAVVLTEALSRSLGPPASPATDSSVALAARLDAAVAKMNSRLDAFKKDVNENAGKKIEGTGLFSVPYFVWLGIVFVIVFVGLLFLGVLWTVVKMYALSNPPLQFGVNTVKAGTELFKRATAEVLKGGENFKNRVAQELSDPVLVEKVKEMFRIEHERAQSVDTQELVKAVTRKE